MYRARRPDSYAHSALSVSACSIRYSGRLHVELFADVFTDLYPALAACRALAPLWLMAMLDARQFGRQRLAPGTAAFALAGFAITGVSKWHQLGLAVRGPVRSANRFP